MAEPSESNAGQVIVGVDGSPGAQRALDWALHKTELLGPVKPVSAYHVEALGDGVGTPSVYQDLTELLAEDARNRLAESLTGHPELVDRADVVRGYPGPALVRAAEGQALLVVGSRGRSALAETFLGSVTSYCVKHCRAPVAVIPESTPVDGALQHLVVGVDGSENSGAALRWALGRAATTGGKVSAIHCWLSAPYALEMVPPTTPLMTDKAKLVIEAAVERAVKDESAENPAAADVPIELRTEMGDARNVLRTEAEDADLLVVGARGHRGATYLLLGSVTTSLMHHPTVATVVVPGDD